MKRRPSILGSLALLALVLAVVNEWRWPVSGFDWTLCGVVIGLVLIWLASHFEPPLDPDEPTPLQQRIQAMQSITRPGPLLVERRRPDPTDVEAQ